MQKLWGRGLYRQVWLVSTAISASRHVELCEIRNPHANNFVIKSMLYAEGMPAKRFSQTVT
jgi:hypothetical protein